MFVSVVSGVDASNDSLFGTIGEERALFLCLRIDPDSGSSFFLVTSEGLLDREVISSGSEANRTALELERGLGFGGGEEDTSSNTGLENCRPKFFTMNTLPGDVGGVLSPPPSPCFGSSYEVTMT